jgi:hypothetical protein
VPQRIRYWVTFHAKALAVLTCAAVALGLIGRWFYARAESIYGTPSCSWPLQVHGTATAQQVGLVRCYLQSVAGHDATGLNAVAANIPPFQVTGADFRYSRDARAGVATATFTPNPSDSSYAYLTIHFADGAVDSTEGIINMDSMGGPSVWRMDVGS